MIKKYLRILGNVCFLMLLITGLYFRITHKQKGDKETGNERNVL